MAPLLFLWIDTTGQCWIARQTLQLLIRTITKWEARPVIKQQGVWIGDSVYMFLILKEIVGPADCIVQFLNLSFPRLFCKQKALSQGHLYQWACLLCQSVFQSCNLIGWLSQFGSSDTGEGGWGWCTVHKFILKPIYIIYNISPWFEFVWVFLRHN